MLMKQDSEKKQRTLFTTEMNAFNSFRMYIPLGKNMLTQKMESTQKHAYNRMACSSMNLVSLYRFFTENIFEK